MTTSIVTQEELAEIDAMLGTLEINADDIAEAQTVAGESVEVTAETLTETESVEIAETVAEIEAEAIEEAAEIVEPEVVIGDLDLEDATADLEIEAAKDALYAEQDESQAETSEAAIPAEARAADAEPTKPTAKVAAAKSKKTPGAPRAPRASMADLPAEAFILETSVDVADPAALAANKVAVIARSPAQVKVAEKFENILLSLHGGKMPSTYTLDCYRVLKASGRTTSNALANALQATSKKQNASATYTVGTARSQAGQFMALAPALKIANRVEKELVLNPDSVIAMALDALLGL